MDKATLELSLCQLIKASEASRKNLHAYSDRKKEFFHKDIEELLKAIKPETFGSLTHYDKFLHKELFEKILFVWLEFLDNSTLNNIPYEIVKCLEVALEDWLSPEDFEKFIIVTSLQSQHNNFGFLHLDLGPLTKMVMDTYGKTISNTLVPINLPRYLVRDYLANVTLYHEIGHFVDRKYRITESIMDQQVLFSQLDLTKKKKRENHLSEFFADLFAAQYIGDKCSIYLNHMAHDEDDSFTHPSTKRRVNIVESFLGGHSDVNINLLQEATKTLTGKELQTNRYTNIQGNDFEKLLPTEIKQKSQLHTLFIQGWNTWHNERSHIRQTFDNSDSYRVINNLIEKSIGNFIVKEKWDLHVSNKAGTQTTA